MNERLRESLQDAPVIRVGDYDYFIHPLTDGVPPVDPGLLREVAQEIVRVADTNVDKIVTCEAMGIPLATAVSLETGVPFTIIRKRSYGLPGELEIGQETGYSKGTLYANGLEPGERVLLVDDVISTGGTLGPLLDTLDAAGVKVADVVVVVEKGHGREQVEKTRDIRVKTLARIEIRDGRVVPV